MAFANFAILAISDVHMKTVDRMMPNNSNFAKTFPFLAQVCIINQLCLFSLNLSCRGSTLGKNLYSDGRN